MKTGRDDIEATMAAALKDHAADLKNVHFPDRTFIRNTRAIAALTSLFLLYALYSSANIRLLSSGPKATARRKTTQSQAYSPVGASAALVGGDSETKSGKAGGSRIVTFNVSNLDGEDGKTDTFVIRTRPDWAPIGAKRFEVREYPLIVLKKLSRQLRFSYYSISRLFSCWPSICLPSFVFRIWQINPSGTAYGFSASYPTSLPNLVLVVIRLYSQNGARKLWRTIRWVRPTGGVLCLSRLLAQTRGLPRCLWTRKTTLFLTIWGSVPSER